MQYANLVPASFDQVKIKDGFWKHRLNIVQRETVRYGIKRCEETGRIANFRRAAKLDEGAFQGIYFNDSDVYKVLEGAAYVLHNNEDKDLERIVDEIIDAICAAQQPDGYLFTYYILTDINQRWTDMGYHEAYCLGHMLEGAIAYYQATGKRKWLDAAERALSQMMSVIGPGKRNWVVGHQELELALIRLYRLTGAKEYMYYAQWLVSQRGHGHLKSQSFEQQHLYEDYCQDDVPAEKITKVTGHAVRAMYYFSAITDIVSLTGNADLGNAMDKVWENVVPANYYLTGGIGQDSSNEGFTRDWHLPNLTAYCETCAAIGMAFWNYRMNLLHGDAKYADIVETELYNGVLAGISLDGLSFFYDNPLSSVGKHKRSQWFGCSCCPTNLMRFIPSIGGYAYAIREDYVYVNQYIKSKAEFSLNGYQIQLDVETEYPWDGIVKINTSGAGESIKLKIRIPGWCRRYNLTTDNVKLQHTVQDGYASVVVPVGSCIHIEMDMPTRKITADARVKENHGRVAFARGPIIYCAEEVDQNIDVPSEYFHSELFVEEKEEFLPEYSSKLLDGVVVLISSHLKLVPYFTWSNRGNGGMAVWIKEHSQRKYNWPFW